MGLLGLRAPRGKPTKPRIQLSAAYRERLRATQFPGWMLAQLAGFRHYSSFAFYLRQADFPASPVNVQRFLRLADAVGFDRDLVFQPTGTPAVAHRETIDAPPLVEEVTR
jgi:hypothetical protein